MAAGMPSTEQLELSERLSAGDERVLEEILRTYGGAIRTVLCRKYTGVLERNDIEDVLSIALFCIWRKRDTFDSSRGTLRSWFFRIADNAARDVLRHGWQKARQLEVAAEPTRLAEFAQPSHNGDRTHERTTPQQMEIREIVAMLPKPQQSIVLADALCREGVASSQLLSEELGIPPSTVRVYRKRAMDAIRAELRERGHRLP